MDVEMSVSIGDAVESYSESRVETEGDYKTEDEAKAVFLSAFKKTECFNIYPEVDCWYFGGSVFGDKPTGRIDFVLTPRPSIIQKGWVMGCVGIECKNSGHKAGPLICQMIDYSKAIFRLPDACGASLICLTTVCCFPWFKPSGAIQSIMANNRCGVVRIYNKTVALSVGGTSIFSSWDGQTAVKSVGCGYKNGSR